MRASQPLIVLAGQVFDCYGVRCFRKLGVAVINWVQKKPYACTAQTTPVYAFHIMAVHYAKVLKGRNLKEIADIRGQPLRLNGIFSFLLYINTKYSHLSTILFYWNCKLYIVIKLFISVKLYLMSDAKNHCVQTIVSGSKDILGAGAEQGFFADVPAVMHSVKMDFLHCGVCLVNGLLQCISHSGDA